MQGHRSKAFRRYVGLTAGLVLVLAIAALLIWIDNNRNQNQPSPVSTLQTYTVSGTANTFTSTYFKFKDNGKWVFDKKDSTSSKFVYFKYLGNEVQHELEVYVNQLPIPSYLGTSRMLPVRIVNNNSFDATVVTNECSSYYPPKAPHQEKNLTIEGSTMFCNPGSGDYSVILSQIGGDYKIKLRRSNGDTAQYIIIYRDLTLDPGPGIVKNIAETFQAI